MKKLVEDKANGRAIIDPSVGKFQEHPG